jgi:hypothetical protein
MPITTINHPSTNKPVPSPAIPIPSSFHNPPKQQLTVSISIIQSSHGKPATIFHHHHNSKSTHAVISSMLLSLSLLQEKKKK